MLTAKTGWAEKFIAWTDRRASQAETLQLADGEVRPLRRDGRVLRVLAGTGWLTMAGQDYILDRGQSLALETGHERALLSAVQDIPLRVEIR